MQKVFQAVGGRKAFIVYFITLILLLNKVLGLGLDTNTIWALAGLGVGGAGSIALEDGLRKGG